jgi:arylsulfatase A-like enzyme
VSTIAVGFGAVALAVILHFTGILVQDYALGSFRWFSRDFLWMAFIAYGIVILPLMLPLTAIAAASGSTRWLVLAAGGSAAVAVFGALLPYTQISRLAALLVALGAGVQVGIIAARRPDAFARRSRVVAIATLLVVPAIALGQTIWRRQVERRALRALPAAATDAPNVLLVVLDAVRAKSFGLTNPIVGTTPRLAQWARSGVVFDRAFSVAPWTMPSHASMFTGRYAGELTADWKVPLDATYPVLAERFRAAGYATAGFVANLHYTAYDSGLERGFIHYDDYETNWRQTLASSSYTQTNLFDQVVRTPSSAAAALLHPDLSIVPQHRYHARIAGEIIDAYLAWQEDNSERPSFAFLNVMDAHLAHSRPLADRRRYPPLERGEADYLASIRYLDEQLDRLFRALAQRGVLDRTVVVVTSDHGELLGEHGLTGHARSLYKDVLHVPLFVRYPPAVPAERIVRPVSLRDLAATLADLAGVARGAFPGVSLANAWRDSAVTLSPAIGEVRQQPNPLGDYPTAKGALKAVAGDAWFYIKNEGTGVEELFAYSSDSVGSVDYARSDSAASLLRPWRERLAQALAERR